MTRRTSMRWVCLKPPEKLKAEEQGLLEKLLAKDSELALGYDLLQRFRQLLQGRQLAALSQWLNDASSSDLATFMGFANGIRTDWSAVEAAFRLPWSNGQLEGQVNRVKLIKRQGYGRAKLDFLRRRVLLNSTRAHGALAHAEPSMKRVVAPPWLSLRPLTPAAA